MCFVDIVESIILSVEEQLVFYMFSDILNPGDRSLSLCDGVQHFLMASRGQNPIDLLLLRDLGCLYSNLVVLLHYTSEYLLTCSVQTSEMVFLDRNQDPKL